MRGFLLGALLLAGLDLVLTSPGYRVFAAPIPFTNALVNWLDPTVPLIKDHSAGPAAAPSSPSSPSSPARSRRRTPPAPTTRPRP